MQKYYFLLIVLFLATSCYEQERNCADFRTGTFEFESYLDGELVKTSFTRNDTLEIDRFRGEIDTSSIRWINDCEYIITNLHPKNRSEEKPLHIKILTTKKNSYTFEYGLVGDPRKEKGTATKVE
ncbi:DNA topoisomerase IV [Salinimicrobium sp. GXAS 041]|uniref:DNA topoisomerase IV n=1 Tax=Salinimicrobium sp. GXAS 041 TaxID=3400806 RepID=UPI003C78826F